MTYTRKNKGVCSLTTEVSLTDDGVIESVAVVGGCNGNLKGMCSLLKGLRAEEAVSRLAREGFDPASGARPLRRKIYADVEDPVAGGILSGLFRKGDRLVLRDGEKGLAIGKELE